MKTRYKVGGAVLLAVALAVFMIIPFGIGLLVGPMGDLSIRAELRDIAASSVSQIEAGIGSGHGEVRARELLLLYEMSFTPEQRTLAEQWLVFMRDYGNRYGNRVDDVRADRCVESGRRLIRALE